MWRRTEREHARGAASLSRLTFLQLVEPHADDGPRVFPVVDEPQGQRLHTLLGVAQLGQLLLQRRLGER